MFTTAEGGTEPAHGGDGEASVKPERDDEEGRKVWRTVYGIACKCYLDTIMMVGYYEGNEEQENRSSEMLEG